MIGSIGLDLGSTRIKVGTLAADGLEVASVPAPPVRRNGLECEGDAEAYARAVEALLDRALANAPHADSGGADRPIGISCQRSTFLLWDRVSGQPLTPMISWQDRRAASWCEAQPDACAEINRRTGLRLSPHYAAPKLAVLFEQDPTLVERACFGTLETFLLWRWTGGAVHETDLTMAHRTLLVDAGACDWSPELLSRFGVPREILPSIVASSGRAVSSARGVVAATIADQACATVGSVARDGRSALVTLGTGGFVLRPTNGTQLIRPGYLSGPILRSTTGHTAYALEGTINGAATAVDRCGDGPTALPECDPTPDVFCIPDVAGIGAPHWRAREGMTYSGNADGMARASRRRVALEGVVFRVCEILAGIFDDALPDRVVLAGGLANDPAFPAGLAGCLGRPVEVADEPEAGLRAAARLAAGLDPYDSSVGRTVDPEAGRYLRDKFAGWQDWMRRFVA